MFCGPLGLSEKKGFHVPVQTATVPAKGLDGKSNQRKSPESCPALTSVTTFILLCSQALHRETWNDKERQGNTKQDNTKNYSQQFTLTGLYKNLLNPQWGEKGVTKNTEWCPSVFTVFVILLRLLGATKAIWVKKAQAEHLITAPALKAIPVSSPDCCVSHSTN